MEEPSAPGTTPSQLRPAAAERGLRARGHAGVSSLGLRVCARACARVFSSLHGRTASTEGGCDSAADRRAWNVFTAGKAFLPKGQPESIPVFSIPVTGIDRRGSAAAAGPG